MHHDCFCTQRGRFSRQSADPYGGWGEILTSQCPSIFTKQKVTRNGTFRYLYLETAATEVLAGSRTSRHVGCRERSRCIPRVPTSVTRPKSLADGAAGVERMRTHRVNWHWRARGMSIASTSAAEPASKRAKQSNNRAPEGRCGAEGEQGGAPHLQQRFLATCPSMHACPSRKSTRARRSTSVHSLQRPEHSAYFTTLLSPPLPCPRPFARRFPAYGRLSRARLHAHSRAPSFPLPLLPFVPRMFFQSIQLQVFTCPCLLAFLSHNFSLNHG